MRVLTGLLGIAVFQVNLFFGCLLLLCGCQNEYGAGVSPPSKLASLQYVRTAPVSSTSGVIRHDVARACQGIHIYTESDDLKAKVLDMNGNVLHTLIDKRKDPVGKWELVEPYGRDHFLVVIEDSALMRIDWNSRVRWELQLPFHHDVDVAENGDIYGVVKENAIYPKLLSHLATYNSLVVVSPYGKVKRQVSFAKIFGEYPELVEAIRTEEFDSTEEKDPMHTNTIEIIPRDVVFRNRVLFPKGSILFSMRNLDLVGVLDVNREKLLWSWGRGVLQRQHCPSLLDNNRILIFDNGFRRGYSRVIELDPSTGEFTTVVSGDNPKTPFFTAVMGAAQRLPNGNTLVVSSDECRAFEVTPECEVVWEFHSLPLDSAPQERTRPYRLPRIVADGRPDSGFELRKWVLSL